MQAAHEAGRGQRTWRLAKRIGGSTGNETPRIQVKVIIMAPHRAVRLSARSARVHYSALAYMGLELEAASSASRDRANRRSGDRDIPVG